MKPNSEVVAAILPVVHLELGSRLEEDFLFPLVFFRNKLLNLPAAMVLDFHDDTLVGFLQVEGGKVPCHLTRIGGTRKGQVFVDIARGAKHSLNIVGGEIGDVNATINCAWHFRQCVQLFHQLDSPMVRLLIALVLSKLVIDTGRTKRIE